MRLLPPQGDLQTSSTPPLVTSACPTTPCAAVTSYGYDGDGEQTSLLTPNNHGISNQATIAYDHLGRPTGSTLPQVTLYTGGSATPSTSVGYDGDGNTIRLVDANGGVTQNSYDPLGRQVSTINPIGGTTSMVYTATELASVQDPQGNRTTYSYNSVGRRTQSVDGGGEVQGYTYDPAGNVLTTTWGGR